MLVFRQKAAQLIAGFNPDKSFSLESFVFCFRHSKFSMNILLLFFKCAIKAKGRKNKTPYQGNAIDFFFFHSQVSRDSREDCK
jgi:hypothetical protein